MSRLGTTLARAACVAGVDRLAMQARRAPSLLVVCYHGVRPRDSRARHWLLLPEDVLERQLTWLRETHDIVFIDEAVTRLAMSSSPRRPLAAVTFDDGYRNNLTVALPVLRRLSIPATVYLATGHIGTERLLWTTWVDLVLAALPALPDWLGHAHGSTAAQIKESLKRSPTDVTRTAIARLEDSVRDDVRVQQALADHGQDFAMLTWDEVRTAESSGVMSFGAHTITHPIVSRLSDDDVRREVGESMAHVAREVAAPSRTFAFPNGRAIDFDARATAAVRDHGGRAALSTIEGLNRPGDDLFAIRRLVVGSDDDIFAFRARAAGLWKVA